MAILNFGKRHLRIPLIVGIFSYTSCVITYDEPYPEKPWYNSMCQDFHRRLLRHKNVDPNSLQTLLERCEEECPNATEGESLRFCADIFCCRYDLHECSYTGEKPDNFPENSQHYDVCMSHFNVEPLRTPQ